MGSHWWEFLQALDAIEARSELFVMVIMLFQFILAHNCVGGRFPLVVITLVLNGTKFSWAGFFPPDLNLCFGGTIPFHPKGCSVDWPLEGHSSSSQPSAHEPCSAPVPCASQGQGRGVAQWPLPSSAGGHFCWHMGTGTLSYTEPHRLTPDPFSIPRLPSRSLAGPWADPVSPR